MQTPNWFEGCETVNDVRAIYRKQAMRWHPDRGGDNEMMKLLNLAYEQALKNRHGETSTDNEGREHTYYYNADLERELMAKVAELLKIKGIVVDLVGVWLWITGDTKPVKEELKALGLLFHSGRVAWYWRKQGYRSTYNKRASLDDLRDAYGSRRFESQGESSIQ